VAPDRCPVCALSRWNYSLFCRVACSCHPRLLPADPLSVSNGASVHAGVAVSPKLVLRARPSSKTDFAALSGATKYVLMIDDDEYAAAAGEDSSLLVTDLGGMSEAATALAEVPRPDFEKTVQRNWAQVLDGHARGGCRGVEEAVHLGHGFVEDGGDHAAMAVSGRAGVAFAQAKAADELFAGGVESEFQAHARWVIASAAEAEVLFARRT